MHTIINLSFFHIIHLGEINEVINIHINCIIFVVCDNNT